MDQHKSIYSNLQRLCLDKSPPGIVKGLHQMSWRFGMKALKVCACISLHVWGFFFLRASVRRAVCP